jgi:prolyl-tRNA editing enzyme YbaK/EbsC (Cys-tRNA(Pro) deacylase)
MSTSSIAADTRRSGSVARVEAEAARLGLAIRPVRLEAGTRTAEEAARACGCALDQIVKSVILRVRGTDRFCLFLTAGSNRVDPGKAASLVGAPLDKADAAAIRAHTGFAIGGVAPIGHLRPVETWLDPRLLDFPLIWAAAGSPNHVFSIAPDNLLAATRARPADFVA